MVQLRFTKPLIALLAVLLLSSAWDRLRAQETTEEPRPQTGTDLLSEILSEGTLQDKAKIHLIDENGKPVFVPDGNINEYLEYRRRKNAGNAGIQLPTFTMNDIEVQADVEGQRANVHAAFKVTLGESEPAVASIPLRLDSCQLTQPPEFVGGGRDRLEVRTGSGYRWFLHGKPEGNYEARLVGKAVVSTEGERHRLQFTLPSGRSTVRVKLPVNAIEESVRGQGSEVVERELVEGRSILVIYASGGELSVLWRDTQSASRVAAVEAVSSTRISVDDSEQPWRISTDVTLQWYGKPTTDLITLALPPGGKWIMPLPSSVTERYIVAQSNTTEAGDPTTQVQIRNLNPTTMQPIELRLQWQWNSPTEQDKPFDVPSLSIVGVDKHEGSVEIALPTSFSPTWQERPGTQLVQQSRVSDTLDRNQFIFRFAQQPLQLTANFRRESKRPIVKPLFVVKVDENKLRLTGWLDCSFDLSQPQLMTMLPGDWIFETAEVVDIATPHINGEPLDLNPQGDGSLELGNSNPLQQEFTNQRRMRQTWRISAFRPWIEEGNLIEFMLPQLQAADASSYSAGVLIVSATDNLRLNWNETASRELLADSLVPQWEALLNEPKAAAPLVYRMQGSDPVWSGKAESLPSQVLVQEANTLTIAEEAVAVNQDFTLQIVNEALTKLTILVREDALAQGEPQAKLDDSPVTLRDLGEWLTQANDASSNTVALTATETPEAESDKTRQPVDAAKLRWKAFEVVTLSPLRNTVHLSLRSAVSWVSKEAENATVVAVPLARIQSPSGMRQQSRTWTAIANANIEVLESENGSKAESIAPLMTAPVGRSARELTADAMEISLSIRKLQSLAQTQVRIGRSWLQTVLNGDERRDRFCAQIETTQPRITVRIPNGRELSHVTVNGAELLNLPGVFADGRSQYQIELPQKTGPQTHIIEIWLNSSENISWITPIEVEAPVIEGGQSFDRFYWQLMTPSVHHLGLVDGDMTPEWRWAWGAMWWRRASDLRQRDLETLVGASSQSELAPSVNSYVLSAFGPEKPFKVWVVSRFVLWLPMGLLAITVTTLVVTFRSLRHPAFLVLTAGGLLLCAMLAPDLAIMLGQTAMISLGLVALILVTQAAIETRVRGRSVFSVRPSTLRDRSDHFSVARNISTAGAQSSTRTLAPRIVAEEGKSP